MNKAKRKSISQMVEKMQEIALELDYLLEDERDAYESVSEHFPESERAEKLSESVDALEEAQDQLGEIITRLQGLIEQ